MCFGTSWGARYGNGRVMSPLSSNDTGEPLDEACFSSNSTSVALVPDKASSGTLAKEGADFVVPTRSGWLAFISFITLHTTGKNGEDDARRLLPSTFALPHILRSSSKTRLFIKRAPESKPQKADCHPGIHHCTYRLRSLPKTPHWSRNETGTSQKGHKKRTPPLCDTPLDVGH